MTNTLKKMCRQISQVDYNISKKENILLSELAQKAFDKYQTVNSPAFLSKYYTYVARIPDGLREFIMRKRFLYAVYSI